MAGPAGRVTIGFTGFTGGFVGITGFSSAPDGGQGFFSDLVEDFSEKCYIEY